MRHDRSEARVRVGAGDQRRFQDARSRAREQTAFGQLRRERTPLAAEHSSLCFVRGTPLVVNDAAPDPTVWLVTGGLGFIGSHFIRTVIAERPDVKILNLDAVTYAANPANLGDVSDHARYSFVLGDICDRRVV